MAQCTAKSKSTGERCKAPAVTGYTVCRMHGAGSPKKGKPGGRPIVHGRYSKRLPERLAGKYQEAAADPRLLELRDEVALLDSRLAELLEGLDSGESGALWAQLQDVHEDVLAAIRTKDSVRLSVALHEMAALMEQGNAERLAWQEVVGLIDNRRKLVESERKRLVEMQQMITAERAMVLLAAVVDVIRRHVDDRETLALISADVGRLVDSAPGN